MTNPQITKLLADLKAEADKQNTEIDETFVEQLLILKRVGKQKKVDTDKLNKALNKIARDALTEASRSGQARIGADELITAYARGGSPWSSDGDKGPWES